MNIDLVKIEIRDIISKSDGIPNCIKLLKKILKDDSSIRGELIVTESEYNRISKHERIGLRANDEIGISYRRLEYSLFKLSEELTEKDINLYREWDEEVNNIQIRLLIDENEKLKSELEEQIFLLKKFKDLKINSIEPSELAEFSISEYWNTVLNENWKSIFRKHFPKNRTNVKPIDIKEWLFNISALSVYNSDVINLDPIKVLKKGLITLEINKCGNLNNIDSISQLSNLSTLKILNSYIPSFKPIGMNKEISILKITNIKSQGIDLSHLVGLEKLNTIEIDQLQERVIHNIAALGEIKSLKAIHIKSKMLSYEDKNIIQKKLPYVKINTFT